MSIVIYIFYYVSYQHALQGIQGDKNIRRPADSNVPSI